MRRRRLMKDRVTLVKTTGERIKNIHASVDSGRIFVADGNVPIEDGDILERTIPSGMTESFEVLDACFYQGSPPRIAPFYDCKVQKSTAKPRGNASSQHTIYNVIGPNAKVNIHSPDSSTNVVNVDEVKVLFDDLRSTIETGITDADLREKLMHNAREMEAAVGTPTFTDWYRDFVALSANHISVFGPFVQALTQYLV